MRLLEAIASTGMTPPSSTRLIPGRWIRFPGAGKGPRNRSGWCRILDERTAVFGDWSSGTQHVWRRGDDPGSIDRETIRQARRVTMAAERLRTRAAAQAAQIMVKRATLGTHPYLARKGFPHEQGLLHKDLLLVPVRACWDYRWICTVQTIGADGTKRFLKDGKAAGGIYRMGAHSPKVALCEGYATGLTLREAFSRLGIWQVIVCFSAGNIQLLAKHFAGALVCADNDLSGAGEQAARATGLRWTMPAATGDFNDLHQRAGLMAVVSVLRSMII